MTTSEARTIVDTGRMPCTRCHGTGIYRWGTVTDGVPQFAGVCFKCDGARTFPASRRTVIEAERALGLRPPAKPRPAKPAPPSPAEEDDFPVPF